MAGCIKKNDGLDFIKKTFHSSPSRMYGGLCFHGNQFGGPNVCLIFHVQLGPPSARFPPITKCKEASPQPLVICTSIRLTHLFSSWTSLFSKVEVCVTKKKNYETQKKKSHWQLNFALRSVIYIKIIKTGAQLFAFYKKKFVL